MKIHKIILALICISLFSFNLKSQANFNLQDYASPTSSPTSGGLSNMSGIAVNPDVDIDGDGIMGAIVTVRQNGRIYIYDNINSFPSDYPSAFVSNNNTVSIGDQDFEGITYLFANNNNYIYAVVSEDNNQINFLSFNEAPFKT